MASATRGHIYSSRCVHAVLVWLSNCRRSLDTRLPRHRSKRALGNPLLAASSASTPERTSRSVAARPVHVVTRTSPRQHRSPNVSEESDAPAAGPRCPGSPPPVSSQRWRSTDAANTGTDRRDTRSATARDTDRSAQRIRHSRSIGGRLCLGTARRRSGTPWGHGPQGRLSPPTRPVPLPARTPAPPPGSRRTARRGRRPGPPGRRRRGH